jgi:mannosyltransferase
MRQSHEVARATHRASARGGVRALPDAAIAALVGAASASVAVAGSWVPSLWGDEVASIMSAHRDPASLWSMLGSVDAVHGLYYLLLAGWIELAGASPFAVRLPSGLAVGAACAGLYLLVRRRAARSTALIAAVVFAMMPRVTYVATEARTMALATAAAVWLTLLLVRLLDRPAFRAWWIVYALGIALGTYLFLYVALVVPVHAVMVVRRMARSDASAAATTSPLRPFALAWATAAVLAAPIGIIALTQRGQIAFRERQDVVTTGSVLVAPWFMVPAVAVAAWTLIAVAVGAGIAHRRDEAWAGRRDLLVLGGAWLAVPATVLLAVTAVITPAFTPRYLVISAPGVAMLIAVGASALRSPWMRGAAVVALIGLSVPAYVDQRGPYAKNDRTDWQSVAAVVDEVAEPGDGVVFDEQVRPSRRPRLAMHAYPEGFRGLVDLTLTRPYHRTDGLWDVTAPLSEVAHRLDDIERVVVVSRSAHGDDADTRVLRDEGFALVDRRVLPSDVVAVYERTREG